MSGTRSRTCAKRPGPPLSERGTKPRATQATRPSKTRPGPGPGRVRRSHVRMGYYAPSVRLNAFLARAGVASRRRAEKTYAAQVEGTPGDAALAALRDGVELEDGPTAPADARLLGPGRVELVIHEGRNHQVKRMLEAVGHPVTRLHRSRYAGLTADDLQPGAWRELTAREVEQLRRTVQPPL